MLIKKTKNKSIFFLNILLVIIILFSGFSILTPKISSRLYAQKREILLNDFLSNLKKDGKIDGQKYWQFREFYSPGSFIFNRKGLSDKDLDETFAKLGVSKSFFAQDLFFLKYDSRRVSSIDMLSHDSILKSTSEMVTGEEDGIVQSGKNYLLIERSEQNYLLFFILPESDMKKSNGFFDYVEKDKELVKGKYWKNISIITID